MPPENLEIRVGDRITYRTKSGRVYTIQRPDPGNIQIFYHQEEEQRPEKSLPPNTKRLVEL